MAKKIELDGDTADRITVINLTDYRNYLKKELRLYRKDPKKNWLHPEDVVGNQRRIDIIDELLRDFPKV